VLTATDDPDLAQQFDVFGEVLTAAYLHFRRGGSARGEGPAAMPEERQRPLEATWALLRGLTEQAAERWQESGQGIWEVCGPPRPFLHGKLMCWAALDRGIRLAEEHGMATPLVRWRRTRGEIRTAILERGFDAEVGAFTQAFGSTDLDASALSIPRVGFLPATDPRFRRKPRASGPCGRTARPLEDSGRGRRSPPAK